MLDVLLVALFTGFSLLQVPAEAAGLYEMITRMFLAACSQDAKGAGTGDVAVCCIITRHSDGLAVLHHDGCIPRSCDSENGTRKFRSQGPRRT